MDKLSDCVFFHEWPDIAWPQHTTSDEDCGSPVELADWEPELQQLRRDNNFPGDAHPQLDLEAIGLLEQPGKWYLALGQRTGGYNI